MNVSLNTTDRLSFSLVKGTQEIASFKYNQQSHSIRIHSSQRRLFFLSAAGLLQNKVLLKTEYGVEIGEIYPIRNHKGVLYLGEKKFFYKTSDKGFEILDKQKNLVTSCAFNAAPSSDTFEISAIIFSLTWLFNPAYTKEAVVA